MDNKNKEESSNILRSYSISLSKEKQSLICIESSKGVVAIPMKIIKKPSRHKENTFDLIPEQIIKKTKDEPPINIPLQIKSKIRQNPKKESTASSKSQKEKETEETTATKLINSKELNKIRKYMEMSCSKKQKPVIPKLQNRNQLSLTEYEEYSKSDWKRSNANHNLEESPSNKIYYNTDENYEDSDYLSRKLIKKYKKLPSPQHINSSKEDNILSTNIKQILEPKMNSNEKYIKKNAPNPVVSLHSKTNSRVNRNRNLNAVDRAKERKQKFKSENWCSIDNEEVDSILDLNNIKNNNCFLTFRAQSPNIEEQIEENPNHPNQQSNELRNYTYPTTEADDFTMNNQIEIDLMINNNEQLINNKQDKDKKKKSSPTHHENASNEIKCDKSNILEISNKDIQLKDRPASINSALFFRSSENINAISSDNSSQQVLMPELQIDNCNNCYFINNKTNKINHVNLNCNLNNPTLSFHSLELSKSTYFSILGKENFKCKDEKKFTKPEIYTCCEDQFTLNNDKYYNDYDYNYDHYEYANKLYNNQHISLHSEGFIIHPKAKRDEVKCSNLYYNYIPKKHEILFDFERQKDKISIKESTENLFNYFRYNTINRNSSSLTNLKMEMNTNLNTNNSNENMLIQQEYHFGTQVNKNNKNNMNFQRENNPHPDSNIKTRLNTQSMNTQGDISIIPKLSYDQLHYKKKEIKQNTFDKGTKLREKYLINLAKKQSPSRYYLLSTQNRSMNLKLCGHIDLYNNNLTCRQCQNEVNNKKTNNKRKHSKNIRKKKESKGEKIKE